MKYGIIILFFFTILNKVLSQTAVIDSYLQLFEPGRTPDGQDAATFIVDFMSTDTGFLWLITTREPASGNMRTVLRRTDLALNSIDSLVVSEWINSERSFAIKLAKINDTYYILGSTTTKDNNYIQDYFILNITGEMKVTDQKIFPCADKIRGVSASCVNQAGHFVIANGFINSSGMLAEQLIFTEITPGGEILRAATVNVSPFVMGGFTQDISGDYYFSNNTSLVILDQNLNFKRRIIVPTVDSGCFAMDGVAQSEDRSQSVFHFTCTSYKYDPVVQNIVDTKSDQLMHHQNNRVKRIGVAIIPMDSTFDDRLFVPTLAANPEMSRFYFGGYYQSFRAAPPVKTIITLHAVDSSGKMAWSKLYKSPSTLEAQRYVWLPDSSVLMFITKTTYDNGIFPQPIQSSMYYAKVNKQGELVPPAVSNTTAAAVARARVWPNPASETLMVQADIPGVMHWQVTDFNGRILLEGTNDQRAPVGFPINTGSLQSGLYFVTLQAEKGQRYVQKFSVVR